MDVLDGVNAKNFDHALRARLGNLNDIKDDRFPLDNQPKGNGLYADNVYLRGTFLLSTGEDIKTKLEITEGKVQSAIDSVRNDFLSEKGYLNNPTFTSGLEKWNSENETVFFLVGNKWIWANGNVLPRKATAQAWSPTWGVRWYAYATSTYCRNTATCAMCPRSRPMTRGRKRLCLCI